MTSEPSWLSLIPAAVAILTAVLSRRPIESLLAGVFAGLLLLGPSTAVSNFSAILLNVMMDETIAWVIIVCGLMVPLVVFVTIALIAFATGSSWGVFAIAIPIVMPLAHSMGVSPQLAIGALVSASAFGSHACFYSDATVLAAQGSGCGVMDHALTQIPYAVIAALLSGVGLTVIAAM